MSTVLVVGSPVSGKRTLVQGLVTSLRQQQQQQQPGSNAVPTAALPADGVEGSGHHQASHAEGIIAVDRQVLIERAGATFDVYPAQITTKYYNAEVSLWRQAQASVPVFALRSAEELEGLEGIIVVIDLRQESSFEEAVQWAAFVDDREQCAFRVCVGSKLDLLPGEAEEGEALAGGSGFSQSLAETAGDEDGGKVEEGVEGGIDAVGVQERRRRCLEWCLDHGFEYVEADCRDSERGGELREKEGVPRIVEALQSNVWTGMEFSTDNRPSLMAAATAAPGTSRGDGAGGVNVGGVGSVSGSSSGGEGGTAELSPSIGDGEHEVSEYLSGFVDGDDADTGYAGYGALDSGDEEEEEEEERRGGQDDGAGGQDGSEVEVDAAHIELQARWEQPDSSCPTPDAEGRGPNVSTPQATDMAKGVPAQGLETAGPSSQPVGQIAPIHASEGGTLALDGDSTAGLVVKPDGGARAAASASLPGGGDDSTLPPGKSGGASGDGDGIENGSCRQAGGVAEGEAGTGEVGADPKKSEERLLEAVGSMFGGLGGDSEGDEMELLMGEVRKARELGDSVPDDERRARAENVAMKLAALLGDLGEDSEDDER